MEASIGIMAYNEEKNIGNLLEALLNQKIDLVKEIIVVNDGSTDKTAEIVEKFLKNKRIKLINIRKRGGKIQAINKFLRKAKSHVIILESADTLPRESAINDLIKEFKDPNIGIVGSRIVPLNKGCDFANFFGSFIYKLHHEVSLKNPKFGEMIAFRNIIKKLPMTAVDEECLAMMIKKKGYKLKYCPNAIVYNKQPTSIKELIIQRRRINVGHRSLKNKGYQVSTYNKINIAKGLIKNLEVKKAHFVLFAILLELYIRTLAFYDYYIKKQDHYVWEIASSTKEALNLKHRL